MTERPKKSFDKFVEYRVSDSPSWSSLSPQIISHFNGTIPSNFEPHLIEWAVIKGQARDGLITKEQMNDIIIGFSNAHARLLSNSLFSGAIRIITSKMSRGT